MWTSQTGLTMKIKLSKDAWDVLESLTGTVEAPADWSAEHDHYLYGTPKHLESES